MIKSLRRQYLKEQFNPSILGVFINPFFIIRRSIWESIRKDAPFLKGKLLDFGCGSKSYKELFLVEEYIGLDVEQSGHSHENEEVDVFYDGKNIPFSNNTFDSCFSSEVFEHVFELNESLQEIFRVLKPGGTCLFVVPFVWDEHEIPYDFGRYSSFGLRHLLVKQGFQIENWRKDTHFIQVLGQLTCLYLFNVGPKNKFLKIVYNILIISPFTILSLLLTFILPKKDSLYFNNVVRVRKPIA